MRLLLLEIVVKLVQVACAVLAMTAPAFAEDRFGADNPSFQQFEQTCRDGASMKATCTGSALGAFAEREKTAVAKVTCDFKAFWRVKDVKHASRTFAVLPWQYGVQFLVAEPGVCRPL